MTTSTVTWKKQQRGTRDLCCAPCSHTATHFAGVALQEFDLLVEFNVVRPQAVQLVLQGLHGLLHGAVLLQDHTNRHIKNTRTRTRARSQVCDSRLPAPDCGSETSPSGWRWWRAASPSGPEEDQDEDSHQNLEINQKNVTCKIISFKTGLDGEKKQPQILI